MTTFLFCSAALKPGDAEIIASNVKETEMRQPPPSSDNRPPGVKQVLEAKAQGLGNRTSPYVYIPDIPL